MRNFIKVFGAEANVLFDKKRYIISMLVLASVFFVISGGISEYRQGQTKRKDFQNMEDSKFKTMHNYTFYSLIGVRFFFEPSPFAACLAVSNNIDNMAARIDTVASLEIVNNLKGDGLFNNPSTDTFSLTFLILLIGTITCMFYGTGIPKRVRFYKDKIIDITGRKVFYLLILSRMALMLFFILILLAALPVIMLLNDVHTSSAHFKMLSGYLLVALLMLNASFMTGVIIGTNRKKNTVFTAVLIVSFIFIYLIPDLQKSYISKKAKNIKSSYTVEFKQLSIAQNSEWISAGKFGNVNEENPESTKRIMNRYYENDFKKIEALEDDLYNEIRELVKINNVISILSPHTFLRLTAADVSSLGYDNCIRFYDKLKTEKRRFLRFCIDQTTKEKPVNREPYENPHIFFAKAMLPSLFPTGLSINLGILLLLSLWACRRYDNWNYRLSEDQLDTRQIVIKLLSGKVNASDCPYNDFTRRVLAVLKGKKRHFRGTVTMDGKPFGKAMAKNTFLVINQDDMPGELLLKDFLRYYKRKLKLSQDTFSRLLESIDDSLPDKKISDIKEEDRAKILLEMAGIAPTDILIFDAFLEGVPRDFKPHLYEKLEAFKDSGKTIIYFTHNSRDLVESDVLYNIISKKGTYMAINIKLK